MKINIHLRVFGQYYHLYRRRVGSHFVCSLYVNGTSIWQVVS